MNPLPEGIVERPILFQPWKVKKILEWDFDLEGPMETRRVMKPQPPGDYSRLVGPEMYAPTVIDKDGMEQPGEDIFGVYTEDGEWGLKCPYGRPGDLLYVREQFQVVAPRGMVGDEWIGDSPLEVIPKTRPTWESHGFWHIYYKATYKSSPNKILSWRQSIHMPKWACRLRLEIVDIRAERIQQVGGTSAWKEGEFTVQQFIDIWNQINEKCGYGWKANPFIWMIRFRKYGGQP